MLKPNQVVAKSIKTRTNEIKIMCRHFESVVPVFLKTMGPKKPQIIRIHTPMIIIVCLSKVFHSFICQKVKKLFSQYYHHTIEIVIFADKNSYYSTYSIYVCV